MFYSQVRFTKDGVFILKTGSQVQVMNFIIVSIQIGTKDTFIDLKIGSPVRRELYILVSVQIGT